MISNLPSSFSVLRFCNSKFLTVFFLCLNIFSCASSKTEFSAKNPNAIGVLIGKGANDFSADLNFRKAQIEARLHWGRAFGYETGFKIYEESGRANSDQAKEFDTKNGNCCDDEHLSVLAVLYPFNSFYYFGTGPAMVKSQTYGEGFGLLNTAGVRFSMPTFVSLYLQYGGNIGVYYFNSSKFKGFASPGVYPSGNLGLQVRF